MRRMSVFHPTVRFAFVCALMNLACACSSPSKPSSVPVIDDLQLPATFSVSGTTYSVQGTITFHDTGSTVTGLHEKIPTYGLDQTASVSATSPAVIVLGFQSSSAVASGTQVEIDVSLVNADGVESNVEVKQVSVP
jgi:hypothetical protein